MQSLKSKEIASSTVSEDSDNDATIYNQATTQQSNQMQSKSFQVNSKGLDSEAARIGKRNCCLLSLTPSSEDQNRVLKNAANLADSIRAKARLNNLAKKRSYATQDQQLLLSSASSIPYTQTIQVNYPLVSSTNSLVTFQTLQQIRNQISCSIAYQDRFTAFSALLELFQPEQGAVQPIIEMFFEAGLLNQVISFLQTQWQSLSESEYLQFRDLAKICLSILINLSFGNKKTLHKLYKREVHILVASLISAHFDIEFHSLIAVLLANLIDNHADMCYAVISLGCLQRFCSLLEATPEEIELRRSIIYFLQACFKFVKLRTLTITVVRTFLNCLHSWAQLDVISLQKILNCFQPLVSQSKSVFQAIAKELMGPLYQLLDQHSDPEVRLLSVKILGDICALESKDCCITILEAGICNQIHKLQLECILSPKNIYSRELLKSTLFVLSNIVADDNKQILEFLIQQRIYEDKIIPLFLSNADTDIKEELAYCIGNIFLRADFNQIKYFVDIGLLDILITSLDSPSDLIVTVMLTAIKKLLRKTRSYFKKADELGFQHCRILFDEFENKGGVDKLEYLQYHRSRQVFECAQEILLQNYEIDLAASTGVTDTNLLQLFRQAMSLK